jgi:hypothetical protein
VTAYVFTGPTIDRESGRTHLDAVFLPPVAQGDVYRLTLRRPSAIGIVDGRFHDVPSVWHKEILWAMTQGIPVYGSASMGALRAAELAAFGMHGIGWIFEQFRCGALMDDDEVTVGHGGPDERYAARSEAMVNIRRTLHAARVAGVVGDATAEALAALAKDVFYANRSYPLVLRLGAEAGLPEAELTALREWLPANGVDQKRIDAVQMLDVMAADLASGAGTNAHVTYTFQHTDFFERLRLDAGDPAVGEPVMGGPAAGGPAGGSPAVSGPGAQVAEVSLDEMLTELRLDPPAYLRARDRAVFRALAVQAAERAGHRPDDEALRTAAERFRRERGLLDVADTQRWLAVNRLSVEQFAALMAEEIAVARALDTIRPAFGIAVRSQARADGVYPELAARALAKRHALAEAGLDDGAYEIDDQEYAHLLRWFFARRGEPPPDDLEALWRSLGFTDEVGFRRALQRERWFRTQVATTESAGTGSADLTGR